MRQVQDILDIRTLREGHQEITADVNSWLAHQGMQTGLLTLFIQHVLASLAVRQRNDRDDLQTFFRQFEGNDDPVPHPITLYSTQLAVPVRDGKLALGARQGLFVLEERDSANTRHIVLHLIGD